MRPYEGYQLRGAMSKTLEPSNGTIWEGWTYSIFCVAVLPAGVTLQ